MENMQCFVASQTYTASGSADAQGEEKNHLALGNTETRGYMRSSKVLHFHNAKTFYNLEKNYKEEDCMSISFNNIGNPILSLKNKT